MHPIQVTPSSFRPARLVPARWLASALVLLLLFAAVPMAGCVEISRTETRRFGNPVQVHASSQSTRFEADDYEPPQPVDTRPWYKRLLDW